MADLYSEQELNEFEKFWQASNYNLFNIKEFALAQELYSSKEKAESILEYPDKPIKLHLPRTKSNYLAKRRKSDRAFSRDPITKKELGLLLSSFFASNGLEHRSYPSAGASYGVEIFCVANNVDGIKNKLLYYNPDLHGINVLGDAPKWDTLSKNVNVICTGIPQLLIVFVLYSDRLEAKYLERGGCFALIEVGAAMQQLVSQISGAKGLKGVAAGGLVDSYWLNLFGLDRSEAKIALGYLCGK